MELTPHKESALKVNSGEEISPAAPAGIRTRNLSITSPTVYQQAMLVVVEVAESERCFRRKLSNCTAVQRHTRKTTTTDTDDNNDDDDDDDTNKDGNVDNNEDKVTAAVCYGANEGWSVFRLQTCWR